MRCTLREWRLSDAKDLVNALSNKNILNNLRDGLPYPYTEKDAKDYINAMLARDKNQVFAFAICIDDRTVGSIGAFRQNNIHYRTAEFGYYLAEEYWGKGIMTDVVRQLCDMLFCKTDDRKMLTKCEKPELKDIRMINLHCKCSCLCNRLDNYERETKQR